MGRDNSRIGRTTAAHAAHHLDRESQAVLEGAAPLVRTLIGPLDQ